MLHWFTVLKNNYSMEEFKMLKIYFDTEPKHFEKSRTLP